MTKALWYSLTGGLVAWAVHLLVSYVLADLGCVAETDALWLGRHLLTIGAVVAAAATLVAARPWAGQTAVPATRLLPSAGTDTASLAGGLTQLAHDVAVHEPERRFLAYVALVVNAIFLFAVVLAGTTSLFLPPCA